MTNIFHMVEEIKHGWEIPVLVMLSLASHLSLAIFGSWRKTHKGKLSNVLLWFTCVVVADWAGKGALASIADKPNEELVLWAAFVLLHLGGPDNIYAYAVEDNVWLRQVPAFLIQSGVVVYILGDSWESLGTILSILTILLVLNGICRFLERIWLLSDSSFKLFIDSFHKKFPEKILLQRSSDTETRKKYLHESCYLYIMFAFLFQNEVVPCETWKKSRELVSDCEWRKAIKLVEIELGFMHDVFYTKARMLCSRLGILIRAANFISLTTTLVIFTILAPPSSLHPVSATILYSLMIGAILMEVCSFFILSTLDWPKLWWTLPIGKFNDPNSQTGASSYHQKSTIKRRMSLISEFLFSSLKIGAPFKACRSLLSSLHGRNNWPRHMGKHDLISDCWKQTDPRKCLSNRKLLKYLYEDIQKHLITSVKPIKDYNLLVQCLYNDIKEKSEKIWSDTKKVSEILVLRGDGALEKERNLSTPNILSRFVEVMRSREFDTNLLIWHVATSICYNIDTNSNSKKRKISKRLSDYMLYLLRVYPSLLPVGCGEMRYKVLHEDVMSYFESSSANAQTEENMFKKMLSCESSEDEKERRKEEVRKMLNYESSEDEKKRSKEKGKEPLLEEGRKLAKKLQSLENEEKWEMVGDVWVEMLEYAASHSGWGEHVQQLRRGAELLTFVRLLMTNFGLTEQLPRSILNPDECLCLDNSNKRQSMDV